METQQGPSSHTQSPSQITIDEQELKVNDTVIPVDNIIAIIPGPNEHSILYTTKNAAVGDGAKESPFLFKYLAASSVPREAIQTFGASEINDWLPRQAPTQPLERHAIISTGSGTGLALPVWESLVKPLLDHLGLVEREHYQLHITTTETSVIELVQDVILPTANEGVAQSLLLLSGDGGIVDIVNTLLSGNRIEKYKNPSISLLPLGTGNALANSSGLNGDNTLGLSSMMRGSAKEVPLFRATFSPGARLLVNHSQDEQPLHGSYDGTPAAYGAVVCSWGLHATLVADSDTAEYRKFGAERFKMAGKEALQPSDGSPPHAYQGSLTIRRPGSENWSRLASEHGYVLATLVSQLEAGFTISPASRPLDRKLRLVQFGPVNGERAMGIMTKAYQGGKHVEDDEVLYEEIEGLRIDFEEQEARWRRICIDGKIIRVEEGGWVEVHAPVEGVVDLVVTA